MVGGEAFLGCVERPGESALDAGVAVGGSLAAGGAGAGAGELTVVAGAGLTGDWIGAVGVSGATGAIATPAGAEVWDMDGAAEVAAAGLVLSAGVAWATNFGSEAGAAPLIID